MKEYSFESEFTDQQENVMRVYCENANKECYDVLYDVLIDTWNDPYKIYYPSGAFPQDEEKFRDEIFDYLAKKYPEYF